MTFLELIEKVLREERRPLTAKEIWDIAEKRGYAEQVGTRGKTPWATIQSTIYVEMRDNPNSKLTKSGRRPTRFVLKEFADVPIPSSNEPTLPTKANYTERNLHPFLTYFTYMYQGIYTKTIYHQNSSKERYAQWLHPDMVGVYFPLDTWRPEVLEIAREVGTQVLRLYSYELKRELTFNNLREAFFQAVSNSSWAHQGYLVASVIAQDEDFIEELKRLSTSFGIGVIKLDVHNPDDSEILIPAKEREFLDINTINRLAEINSDFRKFLKGIKIDLSSKEIRKERYDPVLSSEELVRSISETEPADE